jgi:hypothetical protein
MRFTGSSQELMKLDDAAATIHANDFIKERVMKGIMVLPEEVEAEKERAKKTYRKLGDNRFIKIKKAFYSDTEFEFDFNIGNEQINPQTFATNSQALLASYNPQAMNDPRYKLVWDNYAEALGTSKGEIELASEQANQIMQEDPQRLGIEPPQPVPSHIQANELTQ